MADDILDCQRNFALHDATITRHDKMLDSFATIPALVAEQSRILAKLSDVIDRIDKEAQTQSQCDARMTAAISIRTEQLNGVKSTVEQQRKEIDDHEERLKETEKEQQEFRGAIKFLKVAVPIVGVVAPAIFAVAQHVLTHGGK